MRVRSRPKASSRSEESGNLSAVDQAEDSEAFPGGKIGDRTQVVRVDPLESHGSEGFLGRELCEPVSSLRFSSLGIEQPQDRQLIATNPPLSHRPLSARGLPANEPDTVLFTPAQSRDVNSR